MNTRQNTVLVLGLALVVANGVASGELKDLWAIVKGSQPSDAMAPGTVVGADGDFITTAPATGGTTPPVQKFPITGGTSTAPPVTKAPTSTGPPVQKFPFVGI